MRPIQSAKIILGLLVVGCALLLASPGVRVTPALAGEEASVEQAGPECSANAQPRADAEVEALLARLRQEQLARVAEGEQDVIVLNGRGYNYGPAPGIQLDRIRAESTQPQSR